MQDSAGIRNAFRQGIDCREWLFILKINNAAKSVSKPALGEA